MIFMDIS